MNLPENVREALKSGHKIEAIKLLRKRDNIGLKEAKDLVDEYMAHPEFIFSRAGSNIRQAGTQQHKMPLFSTLLVLAAFVWAMVNVVEVVGSIIVMWHHDGYQETTFTIRKIHYDDDFESGLTWGFIGSLPEGEARMYAPGLADAKTLGYQKLREMYPPGMHIKVWYNPTVTSTLFQHRTLRVIPYTPDLLDSELAVIIHWLIYCLLPFAGAVVIARVTRH